MTTKQAEPQAPPQPEKPQPAAAVTRPESPPKPKPRRQEPAKPVLRFSPTAWAKLLYFRDRGDTEIGGFGITAKDDLLLVQDFVTVQQKVGMASVSFDDNAVADFFEGQVDAGRRPEQFARTWVHSHPGDSPQPSSVDEETFQRVFGRCEWAVMLVLARGGKSYARLRFNVGPGAQVVVPVEVDYSRTFGPSDHEAWEAEYKNNIMADSWTRSLADPFGSFSETDGLADAPEDWLDAFGKMDVEDRRLVVDELAARPDLWEEGSEVPQ